MAGARADLDGDMMLWAWAWAVIHRGLSRLSGSWRWLWRIAGMANLVEEDWKCRHDLAIRIRKVVRDSGHDCRPFTARGNNHRGRDVWVTQHL